MLAIEISKFGGPEVLVPVDRPGRSQDGEVLVKVQRPASIGRTRCNGARYAPPPGASDIPAGSGGNDHRNRGGGASAAAPRRQARTRLCAERRRTRRPPDFDDRSRHFQPGNMTRLERRIAAAPLQRVRPIDAAAVTLIKTRRPWAPAWGGPPARALRPAELRNLDRELYASPSAAFVVRWFQHERRQAIPSPKTHLNTGSAPTPRASSHQREHRGETVDIIKRPGLRGDARSPDLPVDCSVTRDVAQHAPIRRPRLMR